MTYGFILLTSLGICHFFGNTSMVNIMNLWNVVHMLRMQCIQLKHLFKGLLDISYQLSFIHSIQYVIMHLDYWLQSTHNWLMMVDGIQLVIHYIITITHVILVFGDFVILFLEQVTIPKNTLYHTFQLGWEVKQIRNKCDLYWSIYHNLALLFGNPNPAATFSPYSGSHLVNTLTYLS